MTWSGTPGNMERKISLAIVTHNNQEIIAETINSVVNSIPKEISYDFYIMDNNSTDNTVKVIKETNQSLKIIELKTNKGFAHGHNSILNIVNSHYHFVINPDITIESPDEIIKMIDYMENNTDKGMLVPLLLNPDKSIQYLCKQNPTVLDMFVRRISPKLFKNRQDRYVLKETGYNKIMKIDYASGCFMLFRTSIFKELNGFDENFFMYLEDADITRRINEISESVFFPEARVIHRWERGAHKKAKYFMITIHSMYVYFKKWGLRLW